MPKNDAELRAYLAGYTKADPRPGAYVQGYCQPLAQQLPKEVLLKAATNAVKSGK